MTHPGMRARFLSPAALTVVAMLCLAGLTGCTTIHSWAQASSGHSPTAGASVSLPFGK